MTRRECGTPPFVGGSESASTGGEAQARRSSHRSDERWPAEPGCTVPAGIRSRAPPAYAWAFRDFMMLESLQDRLGEDRFGLASIASVPFPGRVWLEGFMAGGQRTRVACRSTRSGRARGSDWKRFVDCMGHEPHGPKNGSGRRVGRGREGSYDPELELSGHAINRENARPSLARTARHRAILFRTIPSGPRDRGKLTAPPAPPWRGGAEGGHRNRAAGCPIPSAPHASLTDSHPEVPKRPEGERAFDPSALEHVPVAPPRAMTRLTSPGR